MLSRKTYASGNNAEESTSSTSMFKIHWNRLYRRIIENVRRSFSRRETSRLGGKEGRVDGKERVHCRCIVGWKNCGVVWYCVRNWVQLGQRVLSRKWAEKQNMVRRNEETKSKERENLYVRILRMQSLRIEGTNMPTSHHEANSCELMNQRRNWGTIVDRCIIVRIGIVTRFAGLKLECSSRCAIYTYLVWSSSVMCLTMKLRERHRSVQAASCKVWLWLTEATPSFGTPVGSWSNYIHKRTQCR